MQGVMGFKYLIEWSILVSSGIYKATMKISSQLSHSIKLNDYINIAIRSVFI